MILENYYPTEYQKDLELFGGEEREFNSHHFYMPPNGEKAYLDRISSQQKDGFLIYLALEVMWNELLYSHFKDIHFKFQFEYSYPKTYFCGHGRIDGSPWSILELLSSENIVSRDSDMYSDDWKQFADHVNNFLTVQYERFITLGLIWDEWSNALQALFEDKDIVRNPNPYAKVVRGMASFWLRPVIR